MNHFALFITLRSIDRGGSGAAPPPPICRSDWQKHRSLPFPARHFLSYLRSPPKLEVDEEVRLGRSLGVKTGEAAVRGLLPTLLHYRVFIPDSPPWFMFILVEAALSSLLERSDSGGPLSLYSF